MYLHAMQYFFEWKNLAVNILHLAQMSIHCNIYKNTDKQTEVLSNVIKRMFLLVNPSSNRITEYYTTVLV